MSPHLASPDPSEHPGVALYIRTYIKLLVLTALTVACSSLVGGDAGLIFTIAISSLKGWLVLSIFMHLRYEDRAYSLVFAASILFLALFFTITRAEWDSRGEINPEADTYQLKESKVPKTTR